MQALEAKTGVQWDALLSHASYKAFYSFHYCTGRIFRDNGADVYLDDREVFVREPISAHFETAHRFQFVLAAVHSNYGESVGEQEKEALALQFLFVWLKESFEGSQAFLAGDFNLLSTNPVGPSQPDRGTCDKRRRHYTQLEKRTQRQPL